MFLWGHLVEWSTPATDQTKSAVFFYFLHTLCSKPLRSIQGYRTLFFFFLTPKFNWFSLRSSHCDLLIQSML